MNLKKVAREVVDEYLDTHPDADSGIVYAAAEDAIYNYDSAVYSNPKTYFQVQIRNAVRRLNKSATATKPTANVVADTKANDESVKPTEPVSKAEPTVEEPTEVTEEQAKVTEEQAKVTEEQAKVTEEATEEQAEVTEEQSETTETIEEPTEEQADITEEQSDVAEEQSETAEITEEPTEVSEEPTEEQTEIAEAQVDTAEEQPETTEEPTEEQVEVTEPVEETAEPTEEQSDVPETVEEPTEEQADVTEPVEEPTEATVEEQPEATETSDTGITEQADATETVAEAEEDEPRKRKYKRMTTQERSAIIQAYADGFAMSVIAKHHAITVSALNSALSRWRKDGLLDGVERAKPSKEKVMTDKAVTPSNRMTVALREEIIERVKDGWSIPDIADYYGLNPSTMANNIRNWRSAGLLPSDVVVAKHNDKEYVAKNPENIQVMSREEHCELHRQTKREQKASEAKLSFTSATVNLAEFIKQQLGVSELVAIAADNQKECLKCTYKRSDGAMVDIRLTVTKEGTT